MLAKKATNRSGSGGVIESNRQILSSNSTDNFNLPIDKVDDDDHDIEEGKENTSSRSFTSANGSSEDTKKASCVLLIAIFCFTILLLVFSYITLDRRPKLDSETLSSIVQLACPGDQLNTTIVICPPTSIMHPCVCWLDGLHCSNAGITDLRPIFAGIAAYLVQERLPLSFDRLVLDSLPEIRRLDFNFVHNLRFAEVTLKNLENLRQIDKGAFGECSSGHLTQLTLEGKTSRFLTDSTGLSQLRDLVHRLPALERLFLNAHYLTRLPARVLEHPKLYDLSFNFNRQKGRLRVIEDGAFRALPSLRTIDLYDQQIELIGKAFHFDDNFGRQNQRLNIFLQNNHLKGDSFINETFKNVQRIVSLHLSENKITYVDETTFRPFLEENEKNRLDFGGTPLEMDCRNYWVHKIPGKLDQIETAFVNENRMLAFLDLNDYRLANLACDKKL